MGEVGALEKKLYSTLVTGNWSDNGVLGRDQCGKAYNIEIRVGRWTMGKKFRSPSDKFCIPPFIASPYIQPSHQFLG